MVSFFQNLRFSIHACSTMLPSLISDRVSRPSRNLKLPAGVVEEEGEKAAVGFEPTDTGVAHQRLKPLGYAADLLSVLLQPHQILILYRLSVSIATYI
jgi:hypothetical protein